MGKEVRSMVLLDLISEMKKENMKQFKEKKEPENGSKPKKPGLLIRLARLEGK